MIAHRLFPELYNIDDFLKYRNWSNNMHPDTTEYENYWLEREKL